MVRCSDAPNHVHHLDCLDLLKSLANRQSGTWKIEGLAYIDRVRLKHPLKTSSKTTVRFYISSPQQNEELKQSESS